MSGLVEIELPENLTIAYIHPIHEQFEAAIDDKDHDEILIKASEVTRADTAGVQLLYAFVKAAQEHNIKLDWHEPSAKLCSAASILGMEQILGLQQ